MIKLIVSDIDGTLVEEGKADLNPRMYDVIKKLKELGITFASASGRQYSSMIRMFDSVKEDMYFIAENGAFMVYQGQPFHQTFLSQKHIQGIVEDIRKCQGANPVLCTKDYLYVESKEAGFIEMLSKGYKADFKVVEDVLKEEIDVLTISLYRHQGVESISSNFMEAWGDKVRVMESGVYWIDFLDRMADKGYAVSSLQEKLGVSKDETMVFGDNLNDLGMLKQAKYSYAVGDSRDQVREVANFLTPSCKEDGVLKVMEEVLEKKGRWE